MSNRFLTVLFSICGLAHFYPYKPHRIKETRELICNCKCITKVLDHLKPGREYAQDLNLAYFMQSLSQPFVVKTSKRLKFGLFWGFQSAQIQFFTIIFLYTILRYIIQFHFKYRSYSFKISKSQV